MCFKKLVKSILAKTGIKPTDRTKKYWMKQGDKNLDGMMKAICTNYDKKTFETSKEGLIFSEDIKFKDDMNVLDLACGIGRTCKWVSPLVKEYIGVDFIPNMIETAKEYNKDFKNAKFIVNDGQTLKELQNNYFDIVYSDLAFQHMLKPIQQLYINEVFRVLKKDGEFYVQIPRVHYYKDNKFANTERQAEYMFSKFIVVYVRTTDAYFYFKVKK